MKKTLMFVAVLAVMLLSLGTANALIVETNTSTSNPIIQTNNSMRLIGVENDSPGSDVVIPFICGKDSSNGLNTLVALGEVRNVATDLHFYVYTTRSEFVYDSLISLTARDIYAMDCKTLIEGMSTTQKAKLEKTYGGKVYYAGYIIYDNQAAIGRNNIVSWVYLVDLLKGFAAGFNGLNIENNIASITTGINTSPNNLCETTMTGTVQCITASFMYPRYYIMNDNPDSFNWWIILSGLSMNDRKLNGVICDEEERCISLAIDIPYELNVVNVNDHVPPVLFRSYPKVGMGIFEVTSTSADATAKGVTTLGWAYQRAADTVGGAGLSWSVVHPITKRY